MPVGEQDPRDGATSDDALDLALDTLGAIQEAGVHKNELAVRRRDEIDIATTRLV